MTTKALWPEHVLIQATPLWIATAGLNPWSLESNELQPWVDKQHPQEIHFNANKTTRLQFAPEDETHGDTRPCRWSPLGHAYKVTRGCLCSVMKHTCMDDFSYTVVHGVRQETCCFTTHAQINAPLPGGVRVCWCREESQEAAIHRGNMWPWWAQRTFAIMEDPSPPGSCAFSSEGRVHITIIIAFIKVYFLSRHTLNPIRGLSPHQFTQVTWSSQEASLSQILLKYIFFNWLTQLWHLLMSVFSFSAIWNAHFIITIFPQEFPLSPLFILFPHK